MRPGLAYLKVGKYRCDLGDVDMGRHGTGWTASSEPTASRAETALGEIRG